MKKQYFSLFIVVLCALFSAGQAVGKQPLLKSPEVREDGSVLFRLWAGDAEKVVLRLQGKSMPEKKPEMQKKDDKGLWEGVAGPLKPGIYSYHFLVDGMPALDPHNRWLKGWRRSENLVEVPGGPSEERPVPHGTVHHHYYTSKSLGTSRELFVYTPPGYTGAADKPLPVLFLLHGSGDDAGAWTNVGRANFLIDNLIAAGKIDPLIVVMPHGHAHFSKEKTDKATLEKRRQANQKAFFTDLEKDILPFTAARYAVRKDPAGRAIAGLSMGGGQALRFGLRRPEQFAWLGGFSSALPKEADAEAVYAPVPEKAAGFRFIWVACGKDDFLLDRNAFFHKWMTEHKVPHTYRLTEGGHSWPVWRAYLEEFLPLLFREAGK